MEFTKEFIEEQGLTPEQAAAATAYAVEQVAVLKKEWDGKAITNAEAIIEGAGKKTVSLTGVQRNEGEKWADYLERSSNLFFEGTKSSLDRKVAELDKKIKEGGGDATIKQELADTKEQLDKLKIKEAKFAEWEENDYKGKYEQASQDLSITHRRIAFDSVKPSFPDTANKFEVSAKWSSFQKATEGEYNIVLDDQNEPWAVDKTNEHKRYKLKDLVLKDEEVMTLAQGRNVIGTGTSIKNNVKIKDVPFEVPENATAKERQDAVRDYLAGQNISKTSSEYSKRFSELNLKILGKTPAK